MGRGGPENRAKSSVTPLSKSDVSARPGSNPWPIVDFSTSLESSSQVLPDAMLILAKFTLLLLLALLACNSGPFFLG